MAASDATVLRFWGVRGSISCPGEAHHRYGGNTSCIELRCGERLIIFDAGTGLRPLGELVRDEAPLETDLFLTHTHHDHIAGLPFFAPFFNADNSVRVWAGHLYPERRIHDVLCQFMTAPLFPVPPQIFSANVVYRDFKAGAAFDIAEGIAIRTAPLNHPNRATGYRVDHAGRSVCYVTDTEHREDGLDQNILDLIEGANIVIYDCSYTDEEFPKFKGWGHSTWEEGVRLCDAANVGTFIVFHHDPSHDDAAMDAIGADVEAARPGSIVAREGLSLKV